MGGTHCLWRERDEREPCGNVGVWRMLCVQVFLLGQHQGAGRTCSLRASALEQERAECGQNENAHSAHGRNCCLLEKKIINNFLLQFTLCSSRAGNKTILGAVKQL